MNKYIRIIFTLCAIVFLTNACDDVSVNDKITNREATVAFGTPLLKTMENVTPLQIPVVLSAPVAQDVKVEIAVKSEEGARENIHYNIQSKMLTIPAGKSDGYFWVDLTDDREINPDRIFTIEIVNASGADISKEVAVCKVVIQSDEGYPEIGFQQTLMSVSEEDETLEVPVILRKPYDHPVNFKIEVKAGGSAVENEHFIVPAKEFTIAAGDTLQIIHVDIIDDIMVNPNRIFELSIMESTNSVINEVYQECKITVLNDDRDIYVSFGRTSSEIFESDGGVWIPVRLAGYPKQTVKVKVGIATEGTAEEGTHFVFDKQELEFPAGCLEDSIYIEIIDNKEVNIDRDFQLRFEALEGVSLATVDTLSKITILNDDIDYNLLYDNLMGTWTITQTYEGDGRVPKSATLTIYGGDTPQEEDDNYRKFLVCKASGYIWGRDMIFRMRFNPENGSMEIICGETVMTESNFGGDLAGKTCHMKFSNYEDQENLTPIPVTVNKNFTELTWLKGVTAYVYTWTEQTGDVKTVYDHFSLQGVVMTKVK